LKRSESYRGSMVFSATGGTDYRLQSDYDPNSGLRRQKSLGPRSAETGALKDAFERGRSEASGNLKATRAGIERQAGIRSGFRNGQTVSRSGRRGTLHRPAP
jgi:hypothetical protein